MVDKTSFTPDEWTKLLESPMMAGIAITAAEPSGLWGLLKESLSGGWALLEAKTSGPNELIKAVATDFGTSEGRAAARDGVQARLSGSKPAEVRDKAIAALRDAAAIVDAKAPDEAVAFKDWLRQIAQKTAEASTEGGFLGFGGVQVSEAEKATLAEIASALAGPAHSAPGAAATGSAGAPSGREEERCPGQTDPSRAAAAAPGDRVPGEDLKQRQEQLVDQAVEETFPASDPISPKRITK
jgi:hypothetical protein